MAESAIQNAPSCAQNTQNPVGASPERGFVDIAHTLGEVKKLLAELRGLGVVLSAQGDRLAFDAPAGVLGDDLLARMRAERDGLLVALRAEHGAAPDEHGAAPELVTLRCPWCGPENLIDSPGGLRCPRCGRLAWLDAPGGGLVRADHPDEAVELVDPDEVPICSSCGQWCDVMTLADVWRCSVCDPEADLRRRRTARVIELANRSRRRPVWGDR